MCFEEGLLSRMMPSLLHAIVSSFQTCSIDSKIGRALCNRGIPRPLARRRCACGCACARGCVSRGSRIKAGLDYRPAMTILAVGRLLLARRPRLGMREQFIHEGCGCLHLIHDPRGRLDGLLSPPPPPPEWAFAKSENPTAITARLVASMKSIRCVRITTPPIARLGPITQTLPSPPSHYPFSRRHT
jgi:hypothetical protein